MSIWKQVRNSFKSKNLVSTSRPLELLHIDIFGPMDVLSMGGKSYDFVIVDDYSRFTWVYFLISVRSDHGSEFENHDFETFCNEHGYDHNFSAPRTPQQNGVVERENRTSKEIARTMLCENNLPKYFWGKTLHVMSSIRYQLDQCFQKLPMNSIKVENQIFHT